MRPRPDAPQHGVDHHHNHRHLRHHLAAPTAPVVAPGAIEVSPACDPEFDLAEDPCLLVIRGDLDLQSRSAFDAAMDRLAEACPDGPMVLDMGRVTFLDSSGLSVLVVHAIRGREVVLRHATESVRRLIDTTGLEEIVKVEA